MPYEYVRFTSKNSPVDGRSLYTVNLPTSIQNAVSVHVKSFSMPNTAYNITAQNESIEWFETIGDNTNTPVLLQATLPRKFYTVSDLIATVADAMTETSGNAATAYFSIPTAVYAGVSNRRTVGGITFTSTQISGTTAVDTFHVTLTGTANATTTAVKKFAPLAHKFSIWTILGFDETFQIDALHHGRVNPFVSNIVVNPILSRVDGRFISLGGPNQGTTITKTAAFAPRDSHESYQIVSSLASSVQEIEADGVSKRTNYLLSVPNTSSRYSWLHYVPTEPVFHQLKGVSLNQFTIGLADEHGFVMENNEHQAFSVVLAIEYREIHQTLEANQLTTLEWRRAHC